MYALTEHISETGREYAAAIFELAAERERTAPVAAQLEALAHLAATVPPFEAVLTAPDVPVHEKVALVAGAMPAL